MRDRNCAGPASACPYLQDLLDAERRLREAVRLARKQALHGERVLTQLGTVRDGLLRQQLPLDASACRSITLPVQSSDCHDDEDSAPSVALSTADLTPRETEVLSLIAAGLSNREIADRLYLSPRTVERHIANIYLKLDVHTKADATAWARCHWLPTG